MRNGSVYRVADAEPNPLAVPHRTARLANWERKLQANHQTALNAEQQFAAETDEEIAYSSMSVLAIVGLMLGLLAPLSLVGALLWVIPIAGAVVSLAAMSRIAGSEGALVGRWAALAGLVLCIASLAAAASRTTMSKVFVSRQARDVSLEWIAAVQEGELAEAFAQTVKGAQESSSPSPTPAENEEVDHTHDDEHSHAHPPADSPLAEFENRPVVRFLTGLGADMQASFDRDAEVVIGTHLDVRITQLYTLRPTASDAIEPKTIEVTLVRASPSAQGPQRWMVSDFTSDDLQSPASSAER